MAITTYGELKTAVENWLERDDLTNRIPEFIAMAEDRIAQELRVRAMEKSAVIVWKATVDGGTAGGTANALTLTPSTAATSYARGDTYKFVAAADNTATATANISGLGAQTIKRRHGGVKENLADNDIVKGATHRIYYDGTDFLLIEQGQAPLPTDYVAQRRLFLDTDTDKPLDYFPDTVMWERKAVNETAQPDIYTIEGDFITAAPIPDATYYGRLKYYRKLAAFSSNSDTNSVLTNSRGVYMFGALLEAYSFLEDDAGVFKYEAKFLDAVERANKADREGRFPTGMTTRSQVGVV